MPRAENCDEVEPSSIDRQHRGGGAQSATAAFVGSEILDATRRGWEELAFTTFRRAQLVALLGFVAVLSLTFYGWQRGVFSTVAAEISGGRVMADSDPAAPRLSSDQVAWTDATDDDSRRSTASFASDRAFADQREDDEPTSGAKLFVATGKKSPKTASSGLPVAGSTGDAGDSSSRGSESGARSTGAPNTDSTTRASTSTTTAPVRYETCAEAAAAGATPIRLGEPGYRLSLDADRDGVACESGSTPEDPGDGPVDSLYANPTTTSTPGDSGSTTSVANTGAGTTSTSEATTTSTSTPGSTTTSGSTGSTRSTTSTTVSTTTSTVQSTTSTVSTTTSTASTSSSTSTTVSTTVTTTSTTSTTLGSTSTPSTSTPSTISTTTDPPIDPSGFPGSIG